jgi:hypothetical protein
MCSCFRYFILCYLSFADGFCVIGVIELERGTARLRHRFIVFGGPLAISGMPLTLITFYSFPKIRDES